MQVCKALRHASDGQGMQFCKACISMCGYVRCRTYHKHAKRHTKRHTERQRHTHHTCGVSHLHPPFRNDLVNPVVMLRWTLEPLETAGHLHTPHRVVCCPRGRLKIPARVRAILHAGVDCSSGSNLTPKAQRPQRDSQCPQREFCPFGDAALCRLLRAVAPSAAYVGGRRRV